MLKPILSLFIVVTVFFPVFSVFAEENAEIALIKAIKTFPPATEKSEIVFATGFDTPEDAAQKLLPDYAVKAAEGRNGTSALFYERTDPNTYRLWSIPLKNLVPEKYYLINVWIRAEGIEKTEGAENNIAAICVEYSKDGKWAGGFYNDVRSIGTDWQLISLLIQTPSKEYSNIYLTFYLARKIIGKIWYDDVEVRVAGFTPAILLTQPDRLSFFGDQGNFSLRTESRIPKHAQMLATISNADKSKDILLKQNEIDFSGNIGTLKSGQVEITAKLADLETKTIVAEEKFLLNAYPQTTPPKNACILDEYNRAVVNGQPFMPLGVYGYANEKNYQRLKDAGFNCLQLYNSLELKGKTDHKDDTKNVLDGLDLIDQYGLKLIFSLKDQFAHRGARKKWGGAEGIDAVSELAVKTIKDHPALLAWYVSDEEPRKEVPLILGLRQLISRIDPWHPTWTLTYRYHELPYYGISGDIIGVDPYPISEKNIEQSIKNIKVAMKAGHSTGLPVWVVPQIFNWGIYKMKDQPENFAQSHFPTLEEMRAMALYAAMLGAKGFIFYSNFDICSHYNQVLPGSGIAEREWAKVVEMVKPVKELEPFILSTKKPLEITVESEPKDAVEVGALLDDQGNYRIIVIGTGGKAKGVFTLPKSLTKQKNEPLRSTFGKTQSLGNGKYEFVTESVDSDILF